jgi:hypothetical protein
VTLRSRFRRFAATMRLRPEEAHTTADLRRYLKRMAGAPTILQARGRMIGVNLTTARTDRDSVYVVSPGRVEKWSIRR